MKSAKPLYKRYRSFAEDLEAFTEGLRANPFQGVELSPGIRKVRMAIHAKGRGKSGGARVITYNALISQHEGTILLLLIYDKADTSNIRPDALVTLLRDINIDGTN